MSLSEEDRRAINRRNAAKSTGPKTPEGKARARANAVKHGLRAETLALACEDAAEVAARAETWNDYYQPASPAAQHLVNECVRATLFADRCHRYHDAALAQQVRAARDDWSRRRAEEVAQAIALLKTDPAVAVRQLMSTSDGCAYLVARWEQLAESLAVKGWWVEVELAEALALQGFPNRLDMLVESPPAWTTCMFNALSHPQPRRRG